jgi:uncharacterized repeat protein (TIGR03803 family)
LFSFNGTDGAGPAAGLTADASGNLFGTTSGGGANNYGAVFEIRNTGTVAAPVYASTPITLVNFNGSNGFYPEAGLIADANGDLFGTTYYGGAFGYDGGANGDGMVFEIKNTGTVAAPIYSNDPTTLVNFNGFNGAQPEGGLFADTSGDLFGTTSGGGANNYGTVFEIRNTGTVAAPVYASTMITLVNFNGSNGRNPYAGLIADANGDVFGTTYYGGAYNYGAVFEIKNTGTATAPVYSNDPTTLVSFNGSNGGEPVAGLIMDANGNLFGTTAGAGTVFEIQNIGTIAAPIYATTPTTLASPGLNPNRGLIIDANGDLFGTTYQGGTYGYGTVFEIKNTGTVAAPVYPSTITLATFDGSNGEYPSGLTADANGNLFGTTAQAGASGAGTVFEITGAGLIVGPTISGTVGRQTTTAEVPVRPFAHAAIGDALAGAIDTLTITVGGAGGTLAEGVGFSGLTTVGAGVYSLSGTAAAITSELDALVFTPKAGPPNTTLTTTFKLSDQSSVGGVPAVDNTTSVIDIDPAVAPTIAGTGSGLTTRSQTPVRPFAHATIGDANVGAIDTLTITVGGAGGTLADGVGFSGLTTVGAGVYSLSGTAAAITSELDALVFTPKQGASNTSSTTTFTLSDRSSAGGAPAVDTATTVINKDLAYPGVTVNAYNGYSLNMSNLNLSNEAQFGTARWINSNLNVNGATYPSAYSVEMNINGTIYGDTFAGNFSTDASGAVTGGTVSAYFEYMLNDSAWVLANSVTGFSYSALDFYNAAISGAQSDTSAIEANILSSNDVLNGSTGNDILYGGGGNDVIKGGGGIDTAVYLGNRNDYAIVRNADGSTSVIDRNRNTKDGTDTLYNITYLKFSDQTVAVNSLAPPPVVVHPNHRPVAEPNNLALSGDVTGPHNFIDMPNFVASYGDLINAFGTNQQAAQNWYNTHEPIEQRAETFDGLDYVASYSDLIGAFKSAGSEQAVLDAGATHFISSGYHEGRTTTFNGLDYIASYGDLINALGANGDAGANHYIENGANEGRTTTFDGLDYIASNGDLINALGANEQAGAEHFIQHGYSEGRTTTFNGLDYIASYGDLVQSLGANNDAGATHYIQNGHSEGRTTTFDGLDYIASYSDLIKALGANEQAGATHFIGDGYKEGRTTTFDGLAYIANYPDLMNALGANNDAGATHYIDNGFSEHRSTSFNVGAYESGHPDLSGKFSSNDAFLTAYINTYKATGAFLT